MQGAQPPATAGSGFTGWQWVTAVTCAVCNWNAGDQALGRSAGATVEPHERMTLSVKLCLRRPAEQPPPSAERRMSVPYVGVAVSSVRGDYQKPRGKPGKSGLLTEAKPGGVLTLGHLCLCV